MPAASTSAGGFQTVEVGHADVHDDDVGLMLRGQTDGFQTIYGLTDDAVARLFLENGL
jgi:hypothetical protein